MDINYVVAQGTTLGPLLFIVYMNIIEQLELVLQISTN